MEPCLDFPMYHSDSLQDIFEPNFGVDNTESDCTLWPYESPYENEQSHSSAIANSCASDQITETTSLADSFIRFTQNCNALSQYCEAAQFNLYNKNNNFSNSSLPTPPHSPPSSEDDLDNIIASIPEILEYPASTLFPAVEDVLLDLENTPVNQFNDVKPYTTFEHESPRVKTEPCYGNSFFQNNVPKPIRKDSMWGSGISFFTSAIQTNSWKPRTISESSDDQRWKPRTISESSDEHRIHSDEEYGYLPETPCVSDEDIEIIDTNDVSSVNRAGYTTPFKVSLAPKSALLSPKSVVNREHNYCEKGPKPNCSPVISSISDSENTKSASEDVRRQLQMAIHESMRGKQRRGRPSKAVKSNAVISSTVSTVVPSPSDVCGAKIQCHTQGKPAAYTKRMREQHVEEIKKNKRRKTMACDPDDDTEKRSNHNIMERNRRVNIRNLFDSLRQSVPETVNSERASKVLVLNKSNEYIRRLNLSSSKLTMEKESLVLKNEYLKKRLQALTQSCVL